MFYMEDHLRSNSADACIVHRDIRERTPVRRDAAVSSSRGGVLLDANGKRFANELGRRDYVSGQMWKNKGPFRLCLNSKASKEIAWHCKHYKGRKLMREYKNMHELAKEAGTNKIHYAYED